MDNSTDSLITARLLATARYTVVLNVLLFALSAQRGGTWSAVQLILAAALLYYHIRIEFDRRVFQDFCRRPLYARSLRPNPAANRLAPCFRRPLPAAACGGRACLVA